MSKVKLGAYTIDEWTQGVHEWAKSKGWWDEPDRNFGEMLMLVTTEVAEAMEEWRDGHDFTEVYYSTDKWGNPKPEGIPSELADVVIRVLDIAGHYDIDLQAVMEEKMAYNTTRPNRHGGKRA